VTRGIETRRHDTPSFIKQFQTELLYILFDCENTVEIYDKTLEEVLFCITQTIDKIMTNEIALEDFSLSKQLRMNIHNYRSIFPHVTAAIQLGNNERVTRGDNIEYVYTDSVCSVIQTRFVVRFSKDKWRQTIAIRSLKVMCYSN
jgi:DNA polymerase elongation subunit (family B)